MKSLKKCFSLAGGRKSGLSFAKLLCGLVMLAVPLCTSCGQKKIDVQKVLEKESYKASDLMVAVPGQNFSILATEVTQELYESVMGENPSKFKGEKNLPVENVRWDDAVEFCNKLSKKAGLELAYSINGRSFGDVEWNRNANGYRLPTESEWNYAARCNRKFEYSGSNNLDKVAWYKENSEEKTHPVAQKKPNGYGLYDMSGNVGEWGWDSHSCSERHICGSSWFDNDYFSKMDGRGWSDAYHTSDDLGFRIVRSSSKK